MRYQHVGFFGPLIWLQLVIIGVVIGLPVLFAGAALLLRLRSARRAGPPAAKAADAAGNDAAGNDAAGKAAGPAGAARQLYLSRVRRYGLGGLLAGAIVGLLCVAAGRAVLALFCCALGYLLGLLAGELAATAPERDLLRTASLRVRRPFDYAPRWAQYLALASALLLVAAPVVFAVAPRIRYGRYRPFPGIAFTLPGGTTSWPSLLVASASAALAIAVLAVGAVALQRVASRPTAAELQDPATDELLRLQAGRAVAGAVLAIELLLLGTMLIAGSNGLAVPPSLASDAYLASRALIWAGLACLAGGLASWLVLGGWVRKSRLAALLQPPPAPAGGAASGTAS
jgi:hypothetical protein